MEVLFAFLLSVFITLLNIYMQYHHGLSLKYALSTSLRQFVCKSYRKIKKQNSANILSNIISMHTYMFKFILQDLLLNCHGVTPCVDTSLSPSVYTIITVNYIKLDKAKKSILAMSFITTFTNIFTISLFIALYEIYGTFKR